MTTQLHQDFAHADSVKHPCRNTNSACSLSSFIQELFELRTKEFVYENFLCTLWQRFKIVGNLFLTEHNLCFYGDIILGAKKKFVISLDEIQDVKKGTGFGPLNDSVIIVTKSGQVFNFIGFSDREKAFKMITALKNGSPPIRDDGDRSEQDTQAGTPMSGSYMEVSTGSLGEVVENPGKITQLDANKNASPPETLKVSLPISVDKFFDTFFSDDATFPYSKAMEIADAMEVQLSKWKPNNSNGYQQSRDMSMVVKVKGVPFKSKTRVQSTQYYAKENGELKVYLIKKSLDVPYADAFQVEEHWTVRPEDDKPNQCVLMITGEAVFSRSVTVEKLIKSRTIEALQKEHDLWFQNAKDRDHFSPSKGTQSAVLSLGSLEKLDETPKAEVSPTITPAKAVDIQNTNINLNKRCMMLRMTVATMIFVIVILLAILMVMYGRLDNLETRLRAVEVARERDANYYHLHNQNHRR